MTVKARPSPLSNNGKRIVIERGEINPNTGRPTPPPGVTTDEPLMRILNKAGRQPVQRSKPGSRGALRIQAAITKHADHWRWVLNEVYPLTERFGASFQDHILFLCGDVKRGLKTREDVEEAIRLEAMATSFELPESELVVLMSEVGGVW